MAADPAEEAALKKAAVNGKYSILLKKIEVKADRATYTDFRDFGEWNGTTYQNHDNLPAGYWVYVYPNWYIWGEKDAAADAEQKKAAAGRKYSVLLKKIEVKADENGYTAFHDYGFWPGKSYSGHDDLPPGYWVYVAPTGTSGTRRMTPRPKKVKAEVRVKRAVADATTRRRRRRSAANTASC